MGTKASKKQEEEKQQKQLNLQLQYDEIIKNFNDKSIEEMYNTKMEFWVFQNNNRGHNCHINIPINIDKRIYKALKIHIKAGAKFEMESRNGLINKFKIDRPGQNKNFDDIYEIYKAIVVYNCKNCIDYKSYKYNIDNLIPLYLEIQKALK